VELLGRVAKPYAATHATGSELEPSQRVDRDEIGLDEVVEVTQRDVRTTPVEQGPQPSTEARKVGPPQWTANREDGRRAG
jgi:hypothetical protein